MTYKGIVSTHSRLKAAGSYSLLKNMGNKVSTHSRLKAAGESSRVVPSGTKRFNTQPPEGGWVAILAKIQRAAVSTHSRLKAAGGEKRFALLSQRFQHTAA